MPRPFGEKGPAHRRSRPRPIGRKLGPRGADGQSGSCTAAHDRERRGVASNSFAAAASLPLQVSLSPSVLRRHALCDLTLAPRSHLAVCSVVFVVATTHPPSSRATHFDILRRRPYLLHFIHGGVGQPANHSSSPSLLSSSAFGRSSNTGLTRLLDRASSSTAISSTAYRQVVGGPDRLPSCRRHPALVTPAHHASALRRRRIHWTRRPGPSRQGWPQRRGRHTTPTRRRG